MITTKETTGLEYHKGEFCPYRPGLWCSEGYCCTCEIYKLKQAKKIIYVSGPYTLGDTAQNIRNACLAGDEILKLGHIPFVPHLSHLWHIISPKTHQEWLEIDLALIPRMDAVLRLPGESKGADNEVALAKTLGIPVYYSLKEFTDAT